MIKFKVHDVGPEAFINGKFCLIRWVCRSAKEWALGQESQTQATSGSSQVAERSEEG